MTTLRTRLLWTVSLLACCSAVVVISLASAASRDVVFSPIAPEHSGWPALSVLLSEADSTQGRFTYRIDLTAVSPADLISHDEIRIRFSSYQPDHVVRARLSLKEGRCLYETPADSVLPIDEELRFVRGPNCATQESVTSGDLTLVLELTQPYPVAIWTLVAPTELSQTGFVFVSHASTAYPRSRPIVRGSYVDYGPATSFRRIDLLNYVWSLAGTPAWIWASLGAATLLLLAGGLLVPIARQTEQQPSARFVSTTALALFCFAAGLGTTYAVLVPPFEAPDEPDHLLSFANLTQRPALTDGAMALAKRGHLERIKFRGSQRFRPIDVDRPLSSPWGEHVEAEDVPQRSSTTFAIWSRAAPWLQHASAATTLLSIRLINVLVFALAVAMGTALVVWLAPPLPYPQLLGFVFLFVPALPFFAMHVSEYAFLSSAYVLLSCSLLALFLDGSRSHYAGLPLGLSLALAMASGRSALPLAPLVGCALLARIAMGSRESAGWTKRLTDAITFWGGFALGAGAFHVIATASYTDALWTLARRLIPSPVRAPAEYVTDHEWTLILAGMLAVALELIIGRVRHLRPAEQGKANNVDSEAEPGVFLGGLRRSFTSHLVPGLTRLAAWSGAAALAMIMIGSLAGSYPTLPSIEFPNAPMSPGQYVTSVLASMATTLRFGHPDVLLSSSFWTGFGWIDTIPSPMFVSGLAVATGISWIALLVHLGLAQDHRRMSVMLMLLVGWAGSLAFYALAAHATARNVQGRYLIGLLLALLAIVWTSPASLGRPNADGTPSHAGLVPRPVVLFAVCGVVHAYCLSFILSRYF